MVKKYDLLEAIKAIDPATLTYQEWLEVGMALKDAGYPFRVWDDWSRRDTGRYKAYECERKWNGFSGSGVTGGTIVKLAFDQGWIPPVDPKDDYELDWDSPIASDGAYIDAAWVEDVDIKEPAVWDPVKELTAYRSTLFDSEDYVGYVTESFVKDGKAMPKKGAFDRTAGELIEKLGSCGGDIGAVVGDYDKDVGAWIRFNPFDGQGINNSNVTEFRYALVESDTLSIERQNALIRELELPVAVLVHSGGKSLHAIVHIDAKDIGEYKDRVNHLYGVCAKNGLEVDAQNKNPSRLSRMPGVMRNGERQYIVDTHIGKASYDEWKVWYEEQTDDLPDFIDFESVFNDLPALAPELIPGILRRGHKMLINGPTKAGKSALLIQLAIAIAEGKKWLDFYCEKGKVLYINLELDNASFLHRMHDTYAKLEIAPTPGAITVWPLRGVARSIAELAPLLINRARKAGFDAVIVDPLYKVLTGDENSAEQMARFFNNFDSICYTLGTTVIYSHHHSKGPQSGRSSMDRGSGSGVFARDPDALLDMLELHVTDDMRTALDLDEYATAWRVDGTLREFRKPKPLHITFSYPLHGIDNTGALEDASDEDSWQKAEANRRRADGKETADEKKRDEKKENLRLALQLIEEDGRSAKPGIVCQYLKDITEREDDFPPSTLTSWLKNWSKEFKKNKDGEIYAIPY